MIDQKASKKTYFSAHSTKSKPETVAYGMKTIDGTLNKRQADRLVRIKTIKTKSIMLKSAWLD